MTKPDRQKNNSAGIVALLGNEKAGDEKDRRL